jgi:hypothetical protein
MHATCKTTAASSRVQEFRIRMQPTLTWLAPLRDDERDRIIKRAFFGYLVKSLALSGVTIATNSNAPS